MFRTDALGAIGSKGPGVTRHPRAYARGVTWLDLSPALIIFTPILLPIAVELGVDPVHFGVIMVVNLAIGLFTPPVGVCLFVACGIAGPSISDSIRALIPFFLGLVAVLLVVTYVPPAVMLIPNLLMP